MPAYEDAYNAAIRLARQRFFRDERIPARYVERLLREFGLMLVRIQADQRAGKITAERAEGLRRSIMAASQQYGDKLHAILTESAGAGATAAADAHERALGAAGRIAGRVVSHSFTNIPEAALAGMLRRRGLPGGGLSSTFRTIINRKVANIGPELDELLTSAIARGQDYNSVTTEVARLMAREDKDLLRALGKLGPRGGRTRAAILAGETVLDGLLSQAKTLLFDSRRIVVSETNAANHEANVLGMAESPVVDLVRFRTSGRHDGLHSSPDSCDAMEEMDIYGFGPGVFHKRTAPSLLHPFCQCRVEAVLKRPSEWGRGERAVPELSEVTIDDVLKFVGTDKTEAFVRAQTDMMNGKLRAAHRAARAGRVAA